MSHNHAVLDRIATWLEAGAPHEQHHGMTFDMEKVISVDFDAADPTPQNWCGTTCCIAGAAVAFEFPDLIYGKIHIAHEARSDYPLSFWSDAKHLLGLSEREADALFVPWAFYEEHDEEELSMFFFADAITPEIAARTIRHMIATGEIDWAAANPEHVAKCREMLVKDREGMSL